MQCTCALRSHKAVSFLCSFCVYMYTCKYTLYCRLNMYSVVCLFDIRTITCSLMYVSYSFVCVQVINTGNVKQQQGNPDGVGLFTLLSSFLSTVVSYLSLYIQLLLIVFITCTRTSTYMLCCGLTCILLSACLAYVPLLRTGGLAGQIP